MREGMVGGRDYIMLHYQINPVYMLRDFLQMKEKTKEQAIK